jgi:hypothetical protein
MWRQPLQSLTRRHGAGARNKLKVGPDLGTGVSGRCSFHFNICAARQRAPWSSERGLADAYSGWPPEPVGGRSSPITSPLSISA